MLLDTERPPRARRWHGEVKAYARREHLSWQGAYQRLQRELGVCVDCSDPIYLDPPPMRCDVCAEKHNARLRRRRQRLKAAGKCQRCGHTHRGRCRRD